MPDTSTRPDGEGRQEWVDAFAGMISAARALRGRTDDKQTWDEFGRQIGRIGARAGLTEAETVYYGAQIWASVRSEHHV